MREGYDGEVLDPVDDPDIGDRRSIVRISGAVPHCSFFAVLGTSTWIPFPIVVGPFSPVNSISATALSCGGASSRSESSSSGIPRREDLFVFVVRDGAAMLSAPGEGRLEDGYIGERRFDRVSLSKPEKGEGADSIAGIMSFCLLCLVVDAVN